MHPTDSRKTQRDPAGYTEVFRPLYLYLLSQAQSVPFLCVCNQFTHLTQPPACITTVYVKHFRASPLDVSQYHHTSTTNVG